MPTTARSVFRVARAVMVATALCALVACKRPAPVQLQVADPVEPATVAAAAEASIALPDATPAAPSLGDFRILRVSLGRALDVGNDVAEERTVFSPRDQIYAVVISTGKHQGLMPVYRSTESSISLELGFLSDVVELLGSRPEGGIRLDLGFLDLVIALFQTLGCGLAQLDRKSVV